MSAVSWVDSIRIGPSTILKEPNNHWFLQIYYITYKRNVLALELINRGEISFDNYSVARTFQLRENVMVMRVIFDLKSLIFERCSKMIFQYFVSVVLPSAAVSFPCFIYFAFHQYQHFSLSRRSQLYFRFGPMEWILQRTIAYALFDLHLILYG